MLFICSINTELTFGKSLKYTNEKDDGKINV